MPNDKYVSPYLLRPLRSYEQVLRERKLQEPRATAPGDSPLQDEVVAGPDHDAPRQLDPARKDR